MPESELVLKASSGRGVRVVEAQSRVATLELVDSLDDQELLERMLEASKPGKLPSGHFLLTTPFRYPPLKHGSRYGSTEERGLFYGSEELSTALAETAFYGLLFTKHAPGLGEVVTDKTSFCFSFETQAALDTTEPSFDELRTQLDHPADYSTCQQVGRRARGMKAEVIRFRSVRCPKGGANLAILTPDVFRGAPTEMKTWRMRAFNGRVEFLEANSTNPHRETFTEADFQSRGVATHPDARVGK